MFLPNNTHAGAQETLALGRVAGNQTKKLEDGGHILLKSLGCNLLALLFDDILRGRLTLVARLHGTDDATPGIHDTLTKRDDVVKHLIGAVGGGGNGGGLLKNLSDDGQICFKVSSDGGSNVAKALQNSRLELVAKGLALLFVSME